MPTDPSALRSASTNGAKETCSQISSTRTLNSMNSYTSAFLLVIFACLHHDTMGFSPLPSSTASSLSSSTLPESRRLQLHAQWSPQKELFSKSMFSFQQQPLWYDNHHPTARSIVYHDEYVPPSFLRALVSTQAVLTSCFLTILQQWCRRCLYIRRRGERLGTR